MIKNKLLFFLITIYSCSSPPPIIQSSDEEIQGRILKSNAIPKEILEEYKTSTTKQTIKIQKKIYTIEKYNSTNESSFEEKLNQLSIYTIPFKENEKLQYKVKLLGITIGSMNMILSSGGFIKNREILLAKSYLKSTGFVGQIYNIQQFVKSSIDKEKIFSYKYEIEGTEGSTIKNGYEIYDSENKSAYLYYKNKKKGKPETIINKNYIISPFPQDLLSIFYYIRTIDFNKHSHPIKVIAKDHEKTGILNLKTTNNHITMTMSLNSNSQGSMDYKIILNKNTRIIETITLKTKIGTLEMILEN